MRTFPKELAKFREIVENRTQTLKQLPFRELHDFRLFEELEELNVDSRPATIGVIIKTLPSGGLQVVVQGFMKHRFFPGQSVAVDGFLKYPDESTAEMDDEEFYDYS